MTDPIAEFTVGRLVQGLYNVGSKQQLFHGKIISRRALASGKVAHKLGLRATARGPWPVARGPWPVARGPWPVARGPWPVARGLWPGESGVWLFRLVHPIRTIR